MRLRSRPPVSRTLDDIFSPDACLGAGVCGQSGLDLSLVAYNICHRLRDLVLRSPSELAAAVAGDARAWWMALGLDLLGTPVEELVFKGYPCVKQPLGYCRVVPTRSAVDALRGLARSSEVARSPAAVHVCTLPRHTSLSLVAQVRVDTPPLGADGRAGG